MSQAKKTNIHENEREIISLDETQKVNDHDIVIVDQSWIEIGEKLKSEGKNSELLLLSEPAELKKFIDLNGRGICALSATNDSLVASVYQPFVAQKGSLHNDWLAQLGFVDRRNLKITSIFSMGHYHDQISLLARDHIKTWKRVTQQARVVLDFVFEIFDDENAIVEIDVSGKPGAVALVATFDCTDFSFEKLFANYVNRIYLESFRDFSDVFSVQYFEKISKIKIISFFVDDHVSYNPRPLFLTWIKEVQAETPVDQSQESIDNVFSINPDKESNEVVAAGSEKAFSSEDDDDFLRVKSLELVEPEDDLILKSLEVDQEAEEDGLRLKSLEVQEDFDDTLEVKSLGVGLVQPADSMQVRSLGTEQSDDEDEISSALTSFQNDESGLKLKHLAQESIKSETNEENKVGLTVQQENDLMTVKSLFSENIESIRKAIEELPKDNPDQQLKAKATLHMKVRELLEQSSQEYSPALRSIVDSISDKEDFWQVKSLEQAQQGLEDDILRVKHLQMTENTDRVSNLGMSLENFENLGDSSELLDVIQRLEGKLKHQQISTKFEIAKLLKEKEHLEKETEYLKEKIKGVAEGKLGSAEGIEDNFERRLSREREKLTILNEKNEELQTEIDKFNNKTASDYNLIKKMERDVQIAHADKDKMERQVEKLKQDKSVLASKVQDLVKALKQKEKEVKGKVAEVEEDHSAQNNRKNEGMETRKELIKANNKIMELKKALHTAEGERDRAKARMSQGGLSGDQSKGLQEEVAKSKLKMKVLTDNQAILKTENDEMKKAVTVAKQTALKLQHELSNRDFKIAELEKQLADLKKID